MLRFRFPVWIFLMLFARDRILRARAYWKVSKVFKSRVLRWSRIPGFFAGFFPLISKMAHRTIKALYIEWLSRCSGSRLYSESMFGATRTAIPTHVKPEITATRLLRSFSITSFSPIDDSKFPVFNFHLQRLLFRERCLSNAHPIQTAAVSQPAAMIQKTMLTSPITCPPQS